MKEMVFPFGAFRSRCSGVISGFSSGVEQHFLYSHDSERGFRSQSKAVCRVGKGRSIRSIPEFARWPSGVKCQVGTCCRQIGTDFRENGKADKERSDTADHTLEFLARGTGSADLVHPPWTSFSEASSDQSRPYLQGRLWLHVEGCFR
jgi:hypothetical protein